MYQLPSSLAVAEPDVIRVELMQAGRRIFLPLKFQMGKTLDFGFPSFQHRSSLGVAKPDAIQPQWHMWSGWKRADVFSLMYSFRLDA